MDESAVPVDLDALSAIESEIDPAAVRAVMGDPLARYALVALHGRDVISIDHLAEIVTGFDAVDRETIAGPTTFEGIEVRLHHVTLPKLDVIGYLSYDHDGGTITNEGIPDAVYDVLGVEV